MLRVSPSTLGNFFFLDCERMLRYAATPEELREQEGIPKEAFTKSVVTEAIIERGKSWEEKVVEEKLRGNVISGHGEESKRFCERVLSYDRAISALREPVVGKCLYQAHLEPPEKFYRRYNIKPSEILFSPCRPDLIALQNGKDGRARVRVMDIKASETTKFSHCVQTVLYAIILRDILEAENVTDCYMDMDLCSIWLLNEENPEEFEIGKVLVPLEAFLRERLPKILLQPAKLACWGLTSRCEWCGYLEHCREEAETTQDISLLPYFPRKAKYFLKDLPAPVNSLADLEKFLERDDAPELFRTCGALTGASHRLKTEVKAMLSREKDDKGQWRGGTPIPYGGSSIALPKGQHVGIAFTLQKDPITGGIFAAGIYIQGGKDIHGQDKPWTMVAQRPEAKDYKLVVAAFLARLEAVMRAIHDYNLAQQDRREQKSLQCYVYDGEERTLLDDLLANALKNPELAERALSLFYYFQSERLADAASHTSTDIPYPVVVLTDVLRELIALPVPVTYKLTTVSLVLKPEKFASIYSPKGEFSFAYSNRLKTDGLFEAWQSGDEEKIAQKVKDTSYEIEKRLKAVFSILAGIRERMGEALFIYPPKFFLPEKSAFQHATLSKLAFLTRYEEVLTYLETHRARTASRHLRLESGNALRIEIIRQVNTKQWEALLAPESSHRMPEEGGYMNWLLSTDDEDGYREQMSFCDFWYREQPWISRRYRLCLATIREIKASEGKRKLKLEIASSTSSPALESGKFYLLHERYTDYTSKRILKSLKEVDEEESLFLSLIEKPEETLEKRNRPKGLKRKTELENFLKPFGFTTSQKEAFIRILDFSHQAIWGPPGTGKTHFLGLTALALAAIFGREGKSLKALVTAFTHAAIENCLKMIHKLFSQYSSLVPALMVSKLGEWKGEDRPPGILIQEFWNAGEDKPQVVGATIFTIANEKYISPSQKFDLVIIDEGSQLKVAEAAIPISRVERRGRLVIAGDDRQLGPIIKGVYTPPEEGEIALFGSIFECLRRGKENSAYTSQLMECFRMNDTLCRFPAQAIYGEHFLPADANIAKSRIELSGTSVSRQTQQTPQTSPRPSKIRIMEPPARAKVRIMEPEAEYRAEDWIEWALCPDYPLVLLVLDGVPALAENPVEARMAADLAVSLRNRLIFSEGPYPEDEIFWQKGLFIVSPHHAQIQKIHQELYARRTWKYPPFVDTVNKMQGQESDCVIISYGVSDEDYALKEGEFIYSFNRLNVAITRAKKKAIVCLPAPLLTPPLSAFSRSELLEGLDFMLRLSQFVSETGERLEFPLSQEGKEARLIGVRTK